jgi:hypothetical protein
VSNESKNLGRPDESLIHVAAAAGLSFEDRGEHEMTGLTGSRRVFALDQT